MFSTRGNTTTGSPTSRYGSTVSPHMFLSPACHISFHRPQHDLIFRVITGINTSWTVKFVCYFAYCLLHLLIFGPVKKAQEDCHTGCNYNWKIDFFAFLRTISRKLFAKIYRNEENFPQRLLQKRQNLLSKGIILWNILILADILENMFKKGEVAKNVQYFYGHLIFAQTERVRQFSQNLIIRTPFAKTWFREFRHKWRNFAFLWK